MTFHLPCCDGYFTSYKLKMGNVWRRCNTLIIETTPSSLPQVDFPVHVIQFSSKKAVCQLYCGHRNFNLRHQQDDLEHYWNPPPVSLSLCHRRCSLTPWCPSTTLAAWLGRDEWLMRRARRMRECGLPSSCRFFLIGLTRDGDHNKIFVGWRESFCVPVCPHVLRFVCVCGVCR